VLSAQGVAAVFPMSQRRPWWALVASRRMIETPDKALEAISP